MGTPKLELSYKPTSSLKPNPKNPRRHTKHHLRQIGLAIKTVGFSVPVLVDSAGKIIAGHGRVQAAKLVGLEEVPVVELANLSEAQAQALAVADNRLTEAGEWDDRLLGEVLSELSAADLSFDFESVGFSVEEVDILIGNVSDPPAAEPDPADELPPTAGPTISKPGDLWLLGDRHRVLCGNALEESSYATLMKGEKAAVVFTDPPYNVEIAGNVSGLGAITHREFAMASGNMSKSQFTGFLTRGCNLMARHSVDGSVHFICMDWRHAPELLAAAEAIYDEQLNLCVWVKHNAAMGSLYRSQYEHVYVFKHGRKRHQNHVQLGKHGRHRSNVWEYPGINNFGRSGEEGNLLALHPTVKPVRLVADALLDCSTRGEIVLDPFLGSGTTVIAAGRTGRRCFGMEIDPHYCDVIIRRFQAYTRESAIHSATGKTFDELAAEAGHV